MIKNYLKITIRNLRKHKGFTFITIAGFSVGIAASILIMLWVQNELSYDKYHENSDDLYRICGKWKYSSGEEKILGSTPAPLAYELKNRFPEIVQTTRTFDRMWRLKNGDKTFREYGILVDPSFFDMFTLEYIYGTPKSVLPDKNSIVISSSLASKYFENENPIGKTLEVIGHSGKWGDFIVRGVFEDIPDNTHFNYNYILHFSLLDGYVKGMKNPWNVNNFQTYVLLRNSVNSSEFDDKISGIQKEHLPNDHVKLQTIPITGIHLSPDITTNDQGSKTNVYVFSLLAFFVLIIACINFMNIYTARSGNRLKEIGLRKVVGAKRINLIKQFFGESILMSFISLVFALLIVEFALPLYSDLAGKNIHANYFENTSLLFSVILIAFFTGIVSGIYPALFLSSFRPAYALKGSSHTVTGSSKIRKVLVVFQFSISIFLIIGTFIINDQKQFINNRGMGFEDDYIIHTRFTGDMIKKWDSIKTELLKNPNVTNVTLMDTPPIRRETTTEGVSWLGKSPDEYIQMTVMSVDYDFLNTFKVKIKEGRYFSKEFPTDLKSGFVINEEVVKLMGDDSPIGKFINYNDRKGTVIGIIKNFNFRSLHHGIEPLVLTMIPNWMDNIFIKVKPDNIKQTIGSIESIFKTIVPGEPFAFNFLDDMINDLYQSEKRVGLLFSYFTILAILISALGLFSLAAFSAQQRTKEIGLRKVLGASITSVVRMLIKDFTKWVLLANIIAWPVAYLLMNNWLEGFAYRTTISIWVFVLSTAIVMIVATLTVLYQAIKASLANPIESLKYE